MSRRDYMLVEKLSKVHSACREVRDVNIGHYLTDHDKSTVGGIEEPACRQQIKFPAHAVPYGTVNLIL